MAVDARELAKGAAAQFTEERYKGPTTLREGTTPVATGATAILPNDPERLMWLMVNPVVNAGSLGFSREVTLAAGIPMAANGGIVSANVIEDAELIARAVYGIQDVAGATWYHVEVLRVTALEGEET